MSEPSHSSGDSAGPVAHESNHFKLCLAALGVVYGDIGTSPLYTVRECFSGPHGMEPTPANIFGILSLIFWSLTLVVAFKYITFIMRADNRGEGGILALLALIVPRGSGKTGTARGLLVLLGLFGAALLYGDGVITPAISVLGAMEGLEVVTTAFKPLVVPMTVGVLVVLFLMQKRGTERVGAIFGPVVLVWFASIALAGLPWIFRTPQILQAVSPHHAVLFFLHHKLHGFFILGAVVLCVTGSEALYADMGHLGRRSIRTAWYAVVFPSLLINYFAQGALLLARGREISNPFFQLVPRWALVPMLIIATAAAVVASQALISGAFSLTRQAVQLGYFPRVTVKHTSSSTEGQIYVPEINFALMVGCVCLVLVFRHEGSSGLAAAYGIAVTLTMAITSILFGVVAHERFGWSPLRTVLLVGTFLIIDLGFFVSNLAKVAHGGWIPLALAAVLYVMMTTWKEGRTTLGQTMHAASLPLELFLADLSQSAILRVPGTAVFMTGNPDGVPMVLLHQLKHTKVLHERVVLLSVLTERMPEVSGDRRIEVTDLGQGFFRLVARFGFMEVPDIREILRRATSAGLACSEHDVSYFLGRETVLASGRSGMWRPRVALYSFLARNAVTATAYFGLPANRVVELGAQLDL